MNGESGRDWRGPSEGSRLIAGWIPFGLGRIGSSPALAHGTSPEVTLGCFGGLLEFLDHFGAVNAIAAFEFGDWSIFSSRFGGGI